MKGRVMAVHPTLSNKTSTLPFWVELVCQETSLILINDGRHPTKSSLDSRLYLAREVFVQGKLHIPLRRNNEERRAIHAVIILHCAVRIDVPGPDFAPGQMMMV